MRKILKAAGGRVGQGTHFFKTNNSTYRFFATETMELQKTNEWYCQGDERKELPKMQRRVKSNTNSNYDTYKLIYRLKKQ